jgi:hypothetical protein
MKEFTKESTISYTAGAPISFLSASLGYTNHEPKPPHRGLPVTIPNINDDKSKLSTTIKYDISLKQLDLGCILTIGDKQIAFSSPEEATIEINNLINNREVTINKYNILFSNNNK